MQNPKPEATRALPDQPVDSNSAALPASPIPASSNHTPQANGTHSGTVDSKKGFHLWVDTLSKIALMVGALIGGLWALKGYRETTAPTLETKTQITSSLTWADKLQTGDTCWAEYAVSLKNEGTTPFTIDSHEITVWLVARNRIPAPTTAPTSFIPALTDDEIVYKKPTPPISEDIQQHYPPGIGSSSAGEFVFKKPTKGMFVVVMRIDVHGHRNSGVFGKGDPVEDHSWTYDRLCP
jgi:hypothetical protein